MEIPVPIRRLIYRVGYQILQAIWLVTRPTLRGVKCVLTDGDRVLLVRHTYGRRWWDLPGGAIQRGEPPGGAAHREMTEELGLSDVDWRPAGEIEVVNRRRTDHLHCFIAESAAPVIRIDPGELQEARWFARDQLPADSSPHLATIMQLTLSATS
ncbi:MAG TPA: NUDIX domain-containing protein [Solirubrobacteraceae bacterium]|jgi:8-oxo-dGTP pyrophosphatase MutT (NUDIX family)|nr:NUDIX domain-containing protein [Solirubrobacteraceae bacterium]